MLIKSKLPYERVPIDDDSTNPAIVINIKTKPRESTLIIGHYRQWRIPGKPKTNSSKNIKQQKFEDSVGKMKNVADQMLLNGHLNVDQRVENDSLKRPEVKALQPVLDRIVI